MSAMGTNADVETAGESRSNDQEVEESVPSEEVTFAKSPGEVLLSKFVLGQLAFNLIASFLGPLGTFFLLFGYLSEGPYAWSSGPLVGVVVGSLLGSPILIFALMPVGMPEAVSSGWFPKLRLEDCPPWLLRWCPFLMDHPRWKWGTTRNVILSLLLGIVYVPIALLIAGYALGPDLETWTLIWFNVAYEVLLALPITALGLLGYAMEHNLDATLERLSANPNICKRLLKRCLSSLKMTVWPY